MQFDAHATLCDDQTLINGVGTFLSDKSFDLWQGRTALDTDALGNAPISDPGRGKGLDLIVQITTTVDSAGGAATLKCELVMADDEALGTNLVVLQVTAAIAEAVLLAGYQFRFSGLPPGVSKRFLGLRFTVAGEAITVGTVMAGLVFDKQTNPTV